MLEWIRKVAATAVALTLVVGGVGCDDDTGFGALLLLLFTGGAGQYQDATIQVDLNGVEIDFDSCGLTEALEAAGCEIDITIFDEPEAMGTGGTLPPGFEPDLEITIGDVDDECIFAATEALTECTVLDGDPSNVVAVTTFANCAAGEFCNTDTPFPACAGDSPDFEANGCDQSGTTTTSSTSTTSVSTYSIRLSSVSIVRDSASP